VRGLLRFFFQVRDDAPIRSTDDELFETWWQDCHEGYWEKFIKGLMRNVESPQVLEGADCCYRLGEFQKIRTIMSTSSNDKVLECTCDRKQTLDQFVERATARVLEVEASIMQEYVPVELGIAKRNHKPLESR
jgi:hypothetical protein